MKLLLTILLLLALLAMPAGAAHPGEAPALGEAKVPIIMYHSLFEKRTNEWNIFPGAFEQDLRYLHEQGYTTVLIADLIAFVQEGAPLPSKPIVLTFDDGYYNNYSHGLPLLERYDARIVLSVIGSSTEHWTQHSGETSERYGHLTWPQIEQMHASGRVEFANHTWALHKSEGGRKGCRAKDGEDMDEYRALITADLGGLQERLAEITGVPPRCFTYPFGAHCPKADDALRELGFLVTLSCASGVNTLRVGDEATLWKLRRNNRTPDTSVREILRAVDS